jgi:REP element-mobilizing transposase RayT
MARKPRIDVPGVLYHVITRGNNRQALFRTDKDRERYLTILADSQLRFDIRVYAYTLMPNHVHLLLELTRGRLAKCMQVIQQRHAQYINRKYSRVGHLYQGRYRAIVCEKDRYLAALVRYLHLNPVRAGLVRDPGDYPWTSHMDYMGHRTNRVVLNMSPVLGMFDQNIRRARTAYAQFIREALEAGHVSEFYEVQEQQILGSERFAEDLVISRGVVSQKRRKVSLELEDLMARISRATHVPLELLVGRSRKRNVYRARALLCYAAISLAGFSARHLAEKLGRDPSNIGRAILWVERMDEEERERLLQRSIDG